MRKRKILIGCVLTSLASCLILAVLGWFYGRGFLQGIIDQEAQLQAYITTDDVSVVAVSYDENGQFIMDESALFHHADTPRILASTMKIVVLGAYATAVADGELDPNELVDVSEWDAYYLPRTDGGAHLAALAALDIKTDQLGFATDPTVQVSVEQIVTAMMHQSDNAATDYWIMRLGADRLEKAMTAGDLENHEPLRPILGTFLSWHNHTDPTFEVGKVDQLLDQIAIGDTSVADELMTKYLNDDKWRQAEIEWVTDDPPVSIDKLLSYQAYAAQTMPHGTAREYAQLMSLVGSEQYVSAAVSSHMQSILESSPLTSAGGLYAREFGAKGGSLSGVLTQASYITLRNNEQDSTPSRAIVIFLNNLPQELEQSSSFKLFEFNSLTREFAGGDGIFNFLIENTNNP